MKAIAMIVGCVLSSAAWTHDAPTTATTTPAHCTTPSQGALEEALDFATHTTEAVAVTGTALGQYVHRVDLRFALPRWLPQWTCLTWEVEVVLPRCVAVRQHNTVLDTATNPVAGLGPLVNNAHWTVKIAQAQSHENSTECYNWAHNTEKQRGWFRLRVKEAGNSSVHVTLPGTNGRSYRAYPFEIGVQRN